MGSRFLRSRRSQGGYALEVGFVLVHQLRAPRSEDMDEKAVFTAQASVTASW